jgi:capsular polysaccharide biosynthesis protein
MEFKEYLQIIRKYQTIFWFSWLVIIFLGLFTVAVQPDIYQGEMTLLLSRENNNENKAVKDTQIKKRYYSKNIQQDKNNYDYYYQLEADKSIAKILVQSLKDKSLMKDVLLTTTQDNKKLLAEDYWLLSKIKGKTLGAGYVKIIIKSHQRKKIKNVSLALNKKLNKQVQQIGNKDGQKIKIISSPVNIEIEKKPYLPVGLAVFFGGLLTTIFIVFGKYYWDDEK